MFFLVCDGLKGLPEVVGNLWPQATVQTCLIHLIRNTFRLTSKKDWDAVRRDLKPIYSAVNAAVARSAFDDFAPAVGRPVPGYRPALGQRVGGVHPVPGLRRRGPTGHLHH